MKLIYVFLMQIILVAKTVESIRKYKLVLEPWDKKWHIVLVNKHLEGIRDREQRTRNGGDERGVSGHVRGNSFVFCEPKAGFKKICKRYCHEKDGKKKCNKLCRKQVVKEKQCKT